MTAKAIPPIPPVPPAPPPVPETAVRVTPAGAAGQGAQEARREAQGRLPANAEGEARERNDRLAEFEDVFGERLMRLLGLNARLSIEAGEGTGRFVYRVVDRESGETLSEWPPEHLRAVAKMTRALPGSLFDGAA